MNSNAMWGIIGVLVAIVIYLLQRKKHYAGRICFSILDVYKTMRAQKDNYSDLSLRYHEFEIEEDVTYVKFVVYNDKSYDYSNENREDPVRIILPENHNWIDARVVGYSNNVQTEVFIDDNTKRELNLIFKLLKGNEFIEIDGLIGSKSGENTEKLQNSIKIKHRIPNVASTKKTDYLDLVEYKRALRELFLIGGLFAMLLFIIVYFVFGHPASQLQHKDLRTGETEVLYLNHEGQVVYHKGNFIWNGYSSPVDPKDFTKVFEPSFDRKGKAFSDFFYLSWFFIIMLILGFLIYVDGISLLRTKKLRRIMNNIVDL